MREFSRVTHRFWTGETGKALRGNPDAQVLALYLISNAHSSMTGAYYLPLLYVSYETGLSREAVDAAFEVLAANDFAHYDPADEWVWVPEMAAIQVGPRLKPNDKLGRAIEREVRAIKNPRWRDRFLDKYAEAFSLIELKSARLDPPSASLEGGSLEPSRDRAEPIRLTPREGADISAPTDERTALTVQAQSLIGQLAALEGRTGEEVLEEYSRTPTGARIRALYKPDLSIPWLRRTVERMRDAVQAKMDKARESTLTNDQRREKIARECSPGLRLANG